MYQTKGKIFPFHFFFFLSFFSLLSYILSGIEGKGEKMREEEAKRKEKERRFLLLGGDQSNTIVICVTCNSLSLFPFIQFPSFSLFLSLSLRIYSPLWSCTRRTVLRRRTFPEPESELNWTLSFFFVHSPFPFCILTSSLLLTSFFFSLSHSLFLSFIDSTTEMDPWTQGNICPEGKNSTNWLSSWWISSSIRSMVQNWRYEPFLFLFFFSLSLFLFSDFFFFSGTTLIHWYTWCD